VDLHRPSFSNSTKITNPLFPIRRLRSALLLGHVGGKPFRTETTLLPETQTVGWGGRQVRVLVSQYVAYLDRRLEEVALDRYAQADDGSVWYFGEDVFKGAIVGEELHADGTHEDKIFAPGYGEFRTAGGGDLEALALAVPTDGLAGEPPAGLLSLSTSAVGILEVGPSKRLEGGRGHPEAHEGRLGNPADKKAAPDDRRPDERRLQGARPRGQGA